MVIASEGPQAGPKQSLSPPFAKGGKEGIFPLSGLESLSPFASFHHKP
jgi:hypothetical protein